MSSTHFACVRILLASTRDDNLVERTLSETDDYVSLNFSLDLFLKSCRRSRVCFLEIKSVFEAYYFITFIISKHLYDLLHSI